MDAGESEEKVHYYHYDALGSVRGLSNEQGKLSAEFDYDAFGNGKNNKNGTPTASVPRNSRTTPGCITLVNDIMIQKLEDG